MMRLFFALLAGAIFGTGLMLSGMTDTSKVQGWLDIFGAWDPTLAFVLGGAILPMLLAWRVAERRGKSSLGTPIPPKPEPLLDARLLGGSALFGFGWALVGLCPGPAMASLSYGGWQGLLFFAAMVVGMIGHGRLRQRQEARPA
ncbi:DUF6691 family protein [Algicella marina]|uniref:YeeE/YedE family protein n=1 Tax=Algicella marina TaxID=2683284 RepID=A0A6P1T6R8_9RHOB|nr:DUF6691 family protein [Algicella marina]QHQ37393.1 hypothetical protein GO499_11460 [Algicella marina]